MGRRRALTARCGPSPTSTGWPSLVRRRRRRAAVWSAICSNMLTGLANGPTAVLSVRIATLLMSSVHAWSPQLVSRLVQILGGSSRKGARVTFRCGFQPSLHACLVCMHR